MTIITQARGRIASRPMAPDFIEALLRALAGAGARTRAVVTSFGFRELFLAIGGYFAYFAVRGVTEADTSPTSPCAA